MPPTTRATELPPSFPSSPTAPSLSVTNDTGTSARCTDPDDPGRRADYRTLTLMALGLAISVYVAGVACAGTGLRWDLDWDLGLVVGLLLLPLGPAGLALPSEVVRPSGHPGRLRPVGPCVLAWLALAWAEVWLDGGAVLGPWAKLVGGLSAGLGTPLAAAVLPGLCLIRRGRAWSALDGAWLALMALEFAGWAWFVAIMRNLRW